MCVWGGCPVSHEGLMPSIEADLALFLFHPLLDCLFLGNPNTNTQQCVAFSFGTDTQCSALLGLKSTHSTLLHKNTFYVNRNAQVFV